MTEIVDDSTAYREAMARAEAASGIERDPETGVELNGIESIVSGKTPEPVLPELEGAAPVPASDLPLTPNEPVAETATSSEPVAPPVEPTVADLQVQLAAAEARLAEKESFIGRQSSEIGDLRTRVDQIAQQQAQPVTPAAPVIPITQELIENNPAVAAQAAYDQRNEAALAVAWNAWDEEGDGSAKLWLADRRAEQREAALKAQIDEMNAKLASLEEPIQQRGVEEAQNQAWKEAFDEVRVTRPDFMENVERLLVEVAPQYPDIAAVLSNGDGKAKAQALEALYALDRMGNPQAVAAQLAEAAQEAEAEAAAARAAAGVVTSQTTAGQTAEQKTTEELEAERYIARDRAKPTIARGFTGRT